MRHDLAGRSHADEARAKLVFQATVDAFDHGAQGEALLLGRRERQPFASGVGRRFAPFVIAA